MNYKDLKIQFRYLSGYTACLSVDSINGKSVHNDISNEEAIIIFNSLVGEKENCQTVKSLLEENEELKKQLHEASLQIQELYEQDIECPSDCSKLKELKQELEDKEDYIVKLQATKIDWIDMIMKERFNNNSL